MQIIKTAALVTLLLAAAAVAVADEPSLDASAATDSGDSGMPVDLTGVWNLNENASDDLAGQLEALREQMMASRQQGSGGRGGGGGMGGRGGGGGGMGGRGGGGGGMGGRGGGMGGGMGGRGGGMGASSGQDQADERGATQDANPRDLAKAMEQLLIIVDDADLEIMDGTDETRIWTPGGKPVQRTGPGGGMVDQAWWDGDVLVLSSTGGRMAVTRRLHLEDGGRILVADVTLEMTGGQQKIAARLVYDGA